MAKYAKYAYLGAHLGARNIVMWGVPEKILQNVQTHWPCVNRTPQSKVMTKSQLGPQILDTKTTFGHQLLISDVITMGIWGKDVIWPQFLNGGLYWHKVNTSLQHFASSVNTIQPVGRGGEAMGLTLKTHFWLFNFGGTTPDQDSPSAQNLEQKSATKTLLNFCHH